MKGDAGEDTNELFKHFFFLLLALACGLDAGLIYMDASGCVFEDTLRARCLVRGLRCPTSLPGGAVCPDPG